MRADIIKYETFDASGAPRTVSRVATSRTLAAMSFGYGVVQLDVTIVNTALDAMGKTLGGGVAELQWVVSAYTIAFAAFILTARALGDRIGAKRIFMAGFAIFTAASLACGGLGLLVPPLTSTLLGSVERARSGIAAGVLNATRQTGSVLGVALFGSLVASYGAFVTGLHQSLIISAAVLLLAAGVIGLGANGRGREM